MAVTVASSQQKRETTCRNCGSVLHYTFTDIKKTTYRDYSGTVDTDYHINCPACKARAYVSMYNYNVAR